MNTSVVNHRNTAYRSAVAIALGATVVLVWLSLGVGIIYSGPAELVLLNGFFIACFAGSAWLFRRAARNA
jgi:hypothetical protein